MTNLNSNVIANNESLLTNLSITEIHKKLKSREIRFSELVDAVVNRIKAEDQKICGYISLFIEDAYAQAKRLDETITNYEEITPLLGIPIAIKDNICVKDKLASCGSKILSNFISPYDATAVIRLKQAGSIIIGKTNMDEFAMGSSNETSYYGPVANPRNPAYVPGGSSGGSAAVVAYGGAWGALGTDTGGSVRLPASFCGVVGLKPTYGRVSRYGLIAFASSLDCIGTLTRSVEDTALIFETIAGFDEMDATSVNLPVKKIEFDYTLFKEYTLGVPREYFAEGLDANVANIIDERIKALGKLCKSIREVSLPNTKYSIATYYLICTAEASSNLARYDGVKYGLRVNAPSLSELYDLTREQGFGKEVKRRILLGTYGLSKGYYDEYYGTAQKVRSLIKQDFDEAFKLCNLILTPTAPTPPFKLGEKISDPLAMYLSDVYTTSVNLAGLPAISIPVGEVDGLPIGMQIIGPAFEEVHILNCAKVIESLCK
ncbi:MAG: Asp-tRNA(Asn)/Glu-tRNA(Gln) amidotransferase subunit GatA [candidate division WOR-3 bacterium]|nr:Asp-tRNA(Asn)/Glu-tRNA(Gln) amidotransferase subunit GatA [candidate division WOR-3 bacterium]